MRRPVVVEDIAEVAIIDSLTAVPPAVEVLALIRWFEACEDARGGTTGSGDDVLPLNHATISRMVA